MSSISQPWTQPAERLLRWPFLGNLMTLAQAAAAVLALWSLWTLTATPVVVTVDGITETVHTHRRTLAPLLADLGLELHPADRVSPGLDTRLRPDMTVTVERARPVRVLADGRDLTAYVWGETPRSALREAGIPVDDYDRVYVNGQPVALDAPLPPRNATLAQPTYNPGHPWENLQVDSLQLRVYRSIPITVDDGNVPYTIRTTA
ncbi:MAG: DUF348 domain-containing protein, partial [Caldilineae bacterium]